MPTAWPMPPWTPPAGAAGAASRAQPPAARPDPRAIPWAPRSARPRPRPTGCAPTTLKACWCPLNLSICRKAPRFPSNCVSPRRCRSYHPANPTEAVLETGTKGSLFRHTPVATLVRGENAVDSFTRQVADHLSAGSARGDLRVPAETLGNQAYWVLDCGLVPAVCSLLRQDI